MINERTDKILVAGASGAIGRRLCRLLVDDGWSVIGTSRFHEKESMLVQMGVEPVIVDVFDEPSLLAAFRKAQARVVIHQLTDLPPALDPSRMAEARIRNARIREVGTRNLVAAATAAGAQRIVAQSIAFAYAPGPTPYNEEAPLNLDDPSFAATAQAVASLERQVLEAPVEGVILRYGKLYGPGTGFEQAPIDCPVHVDAAAHAARLAVEYGRSGIYNISESGGTVSIKKAIDTLRWTPDFRVDEG